MKHQAQGATRFALVLILTIMALCSCSTLSAGDAAIVAQPPSFAKAWVPTNPVWGRAIVIGETADLVAFEAQFKVVLGDTDLEAHQIGCTGCDQLPSTTVHRLVYVFPRQDASIFRTFGKTWDDVERSVHHTAFTLQFDSDVPVADCPYPPHPQPCANTSYCADKCGRNGICSAC